jgi:hypothetical protein
MYVGCCERALVWRSRCFLVPLLYVVTLPTRQACPHLRNVSRLLSHVPHAYALHIQCAQPYFPQNHIHTHVQRVPLYTLVFHHTLHVTRSHAHAYTTHTHSYTPPPHTYTHTLSLSYIHSLTHTSYATHICTHSGTQNSMQKPRVWRMGTSCRR